MTQPSPDASQRRLRIGLDLGGNHVKAALGTGADAHLLWHDDFPTETRGGRESICKSMETAARAAIRAADELGAEVVAVGIGSPGVVDRTTGAFLYEIANLPGMQGVSFSQLFFDEFGLTTRVENDANVAALAEARFGAGREHHSVVIATVGTGIGGGAVIGGQLLVGDHGAAMELGHVPYAANGRTCGCGKRGCVEAYAGGRGMRGIWLERRAQAGLEVDADATLRDLIDAVGDGDAMATKVLEEGADVLSIGLVGALHLINPGALIIGGGVVDGCAWFFDRVTAGILERALPKATAKLDVARAQFGNRAGVIGALALVASDGD